MAELMSRSVSFWAIQVCIAGTLVMTAGMSIAMKARRFRQ